MAAISRILVLCAVILAQNYFPSDLGSPFIVALGLSIMALTKIPRSYLKFVWPLLGIVTIGSLGIFDQESRHILRDISFALTPIALIFMGYWMAVKRGMLPLIFRTMVILGFVFALIHLGTFAQNPHLLSGESMDVRKAAGGTGDLVVLAFLIGLFQKNFGINDLFPKLFTRFIVLPVLFASFVLTYSRTELVIGVLLAFSLLGWLSRINFRFMSAVAVVLLSYVTLAVIVPEDETGTFRSKLLRSVTEVTVSDYQAMSDINNNWRGFETNRAVTTYLAGNAQQQLFGQGFGALVDLGFYMPLGGQSFRHIPITHNGYAYILIKAGALGLLCYAFFYIRMIKYAVRYGNSLDMERRMLARMLLGCVLSLIAAMYVVGGMAEMHNPEMVLLLGYLARRIWRFQPENNHAETRRIFMKTSERSRHREVSGL
jgi:hypothetical protein